MIPKLLLGLFIVCVLLTSIEIQAKTNKLKLATLTIINYEGGCFDVKHGNKFIMRCA